MTVCQSPHATIPHTCGRLDSCIGWRLIASCADAVCSEPSIFTRVTITGSIIVHWAVRTSHGSEAGRHQADLVGIQCKWYDLQQWTNLAKRLLVLSIGRYGGTVLPGSDQPLKEWYAHTDGPEREPKQHVLIRVFNMTPTCGDILYLLYGSVPYTIIVFMFWCKRTELCVLTFRWFPGIFAYT